MRGQNHWQTKAPVTEADHKRIGNYKTKQTTKQTAKADAGLIIPCPEQKPHRSADGPRQTRGHKQE